jgi:hypothetical protein
MSRIQMTQAVSADYADAMLVARRAKNVLFILLALVLLIQLAVFFVVRYVPGVNIRPAMSATDPIWVAQRSEAKTPSSAISWPQTMQYVVAGTNYLGVLLPIVLSVVLLLIVGIMLVGRLVGVSYFTGAFCWSVIFIVLLIPWQALFSTPTYAMSAPGSGNVNSVRDVRLPGILYTYPELVQNYDFETTDWKSDSAYIILHWARFVGFPVFALLVLLSIQGRSSRGLRLALGEAELPVAANPPTA